MINLSFKWNASLIITMGVEQGAPERLKKAVGGAIPSSREGVGRDLAASLNPFPQAHIQPHPSPGKEF